MTSGRFLGEGMRRLAVFDAPLIFDWIRLAGGRVE
jgi:hypothetical protein